MSNCTGVRTAPASDQNDVQGKQPCITVQADSSFRGQGDYYTGLPSHWPHQADRLTRGAKY